MGKNFRLICDSKHTISESLFWICSSQFIVRNARSLNTSQCQLLSSHLRWWLAQAATVSHQWAHIWTVDATSPPNLTVIEARVLKEAPATITRDDGSVWTKCRGQPSSAASGSHVASGVAGPSALGQDDERMPAAKAKAKSSSGQAKSKAKTPPIAPTKASTCKLLLRSSPIQKQCSTNSHVTDSFLKTLVHLVSVVGLQLRLLGICDS